MIESCPICHRPAQLSPASRYKHNSKAEDRLCKIQLEIINLRLEERELLKKLGKQYLDSTNPAQG